MLIRTVYQITKNDVDGAHRPEDVTKRETARRLVREEKGIIGNLWVSEKWQYPLDEKNGYFEISEELSLNW